MFPLRSIAFLIIFFGLSTVSLAIPIIGVANYMLVYQIFPEHAWWHIPLAPFEIRYSMTAAVCMIIGIVLNAHRMDSVRPALSLWDTLAMVMVLIVLLSELTGVGLSRETDVLLDKFVKIMVFVFCLSRVTTNKRNYTIVMWTLVFGSLYIGYDAWTAPRGAFARGRLDQVGGPDFRHASGLAAHMAMMLPIIGAFFMINRSWLARGVIGLGGALTINTVVLCRTRSAFVGLVCGAIATCLFAPRRHRFKTYIAMFIALGCGYALTDSPYWERMGTMRSQETLMDDPAVSYRLEIWQDAWQMIRDHPLGIGIGNFSSMMAVVNPTLGRRAAHNTFMLCWTELGLQGFIVFVALLITSFVQSFQCLWQARHTEDSAWTRYMAFGLIVSLIICIGTQCFTERLYTEAFWWILALPGCLKRVVIRERVAMQMRAGQPPPHWDIDGWIQQNPLLHDGGARRSLA